MKPTKEQLVIACAYLAFMLIFYFWGITKASFASFVAIVLLTGVFAGLVWLVKKILAK